MSNYIYGFLDLKRDRGQEVEDIVNAIWARSPIAFHTLECANISQTLGLSAKDDRFCFCLSDNSQTFLATNLLFEIDWSEDFKGNVPKKLRDRVALIVEAVKIVLEESGCRWVGIWVSEEDQFEGVVKTDVANLFDALYSDFMESGVPCKLYEISG